MESYEKAYFGGGCFWCTEAIFKMLNGVEGVTPGYSGGTTSHPNYQNIGDHAEVIEIEFDPKVVSYRSLLTVFFATHDPTTPNQQGADIGTQYRSLILCTSIAQYKEAEEFIKKLNSSTKAGEPIVTELKEFNRFFPAEDYHRNFFARNQGTPYCQIVINPKLAKVKKDFAALLV